MAIGVIGVVACQIGTIDGSSIACVEQRRVDGSGIAIECHSFAEPILIHRRDDGTVLRTPGFLFDQRREGHDFVNWPGAGRSLQFAPLLAELAGHHHAELLHAGGSRDAIGGGKQVTFERGRFGREIADECRISGRLQKVRGFEETEATDASSDVKHVAAFGHHQFVEEDVATRDAIASTKKKELLSQSGDTFELTLLLTQTEALNYGWHLAQVAEENEPNHERAAALASLSDDMQNLYQETFTLLLSKMQSSATNSN